MLQNWILFFNSLLGEAGIPYFNYHHVLNNDIAVPLSLISASPVLFNGNKTR